MVPVEDEYDDREFYYEPGIYIEGKYGCRIEDMIGIKADGTAHDFTKSRKDLIELF